MLTVLLVWNLGLTFTVVNMASTSEANNTDSTGEQRNAKYLSDVSAVIESGRSAMVTLKAYYDDRTVSSNGVIYSTVDDIVYIFVPYNPVHGANSLTVTFDSGVTLDAYPVGEDFTTGLALIACYPSFSVRTQVIGNSDSVKDGQYVVALSGRKQESASALTSFGVVSSSGMYRTSILSRVYADMISMDFTVGEDMYGGALLNTKGELVGLLASQPFQGVQGCGYAVSINEAKLVYEQLRYKGSVTRGNPGIVYREVADLKSYEKNELGIPLDQSTGMLVTYVWDEGASQHTLKAGDVIMSADGEELNSAQVFRKVLYSHNPGDTLDLKFYSEGETHSVSLMLK